VGQGDSSGQHQAGVSSILSLPFKPYGRFGDDRSLFQPYVSERLRRHASVQNDRSTFARRRPVKIWRCLGLVRGRLFRRRHNCWD
jgi:hypothetical protein